MSSLELSERVSIAAPPDAVFEMLLDPEALVGCLPGASLESVESETAFLGEVKVKVGTVTLAYKGRIELLQVDREARRIEARGEGREKGAAGKLGVSLEGAVTPDEQGAALEVHARVKLAGKIVRFGRGMLDAVSKQLFEDFATALKARIETNTPTLPEADPTPVRALPLLLRALKSWLKRLLRIP